VASFIPTLYAGSRPDTGPKLLGGASAGAIAAAFAAAAEHGRSTNHGSSVIADVETAANQASSGLLRLHEVPGELGTSLGELFQPSPRTKACYQLPTVWLKPERPKLNKVVAETAEIQGVRSPGKLWWALKGWAPAGAAW
jgi:hypothetical protein